MVVYVAVMPHEIECQSAAIGANRIFYRCECSRDRSIGPVLPIFNAQYHRIDRKPLLRENRTMLKKFFPLALLLCLVGLTATGCEEDPLGADGPAMKAEVDGNDWTATSVTTVELSNSFNITASAADGSSIILSIPKDATAGSTNTISLTYSARFNSDASTPLLGTTGEIKVDDIDATSVSGEFEFDATDGTTTVEVKNGEFSAEVNG